MEEIGRIITVREQVVEERDFQAARFRLDTLHVNILTHEVSLEYHLCDASGELIGCTRYMTLNPPTTIEGETIDRWNQIVQEDKLDLRLVKSIFKEII
jgi:hypothetical protein